MKPTGLTYEHWGILPEFIVRLEADDSNSRITCNELGSNVIWIAILPQSDDTVFPSSEKLEAISNNIDALAEWVSPIDGQPNSYLLHDGVKVIFKDEGIQTHNGFPQAHIKGPAVLVDESAVQA